MSSQEIRQDLITKQWTICAPARDQRPHDTDEPDTHDPTDATPVSGCPFCPGHEEMLPEVLWESNGISDAPWATRAVPNKYPALTPDPDPEEQACGLYRVRGGFGQQEVLIDTPYHHQPLAKMPSAQVEAVIDTYLARYQAIRTSDADLYPFVFRNHGPGAGASLQHPHSQMIATPMAPPRIVFEEAQAKAHYDETGRCAYCEMLEEERAAGARVVMENEGFTVFVPYAASDPYTMWVMPRVHRAEFGTLSGPAKAQFANALGAALRALHRTLGDPDYNFYLRTPIAYDSHAPHLHWTLRIRPRTTVDAGFELGTGVTINPSLPETNAAYLREGIANDG